MLRRWQVLVNIYATLAGKLVQTASTQCLYVHLTSTKKETCSLLQSIISRRLSEHSSLNAISSTDGISLLPTTLSLVINEGGNNRRDFCRSIHNESVERRLI